MTFLGERATVGREQIDAAAEVIRSDVRVTPTIVVPGSDFGLGVELVFKLEHLQHSGSFKARGAAHAVLTGPIDAGGVVAASGGNHGAAVAWAARRFDHDAHVFVPTTSSPAKVARLRQYGAIVHQIGDVYADAFEASREHLATFGGTSIHAYDDPTVMAGAGTCGRELDIQAPDLSAVLLACGGGGLAGGCAAWFGDRAEIVAVETHGTATYAAATVAGEPSDIAVSGLVADSLGASRLGTNPWAVLRRVGATSVVVTDDDLITARDALWTRLRIVVELAAAAPLAALVTGAWQPNGDRVGIVLCGANTAIELPPRTAPPTAEPIPAAGRVPARRHEAD